ncbi:MAG TPA: hypothetical protein VFI05_06590 [Nitrospiraceae bacterium]|nr:hypothetical protein [Nitrospiraceae bacterium]
MRGAVLYGPRDIRFEDRPEPTIIEPTDALIMTHIAIVEQLDGKTVEWMEKVSDEQYQAGLRAE